MITFIIKGTNGCNFTCRYCSLGEKSNFQYVNKESLEHMFTFAGNVAQQYGETDVYLILHGGEPTLVDVEVYEYALNQVKNRFPNLHIEAAIQSNGYYFSEQWIAFIRKYEIHVGISIDGAADIHDAERITADGKPTYRMVEQSVEKLLDAGIPIGGLMVLTQNALQKGYEYLRFYAEKDISLKINPLLNYGDTVNHPELILKPGEYADYLIGLFRYVIEQDLAVSVSPLEGILQAVVHKQKIRECAFNSDCNRHFLCIDYLGNIYPCGKFSDMDACCIGNIDSTPPNVFDLPQMKVLQERRTIQLPEKCRTCEFEHFCNAGCNAEACIDGGLTGTPFLCEDYKRLFRFCQKEGLLLLREKLLKRKEQLEAKL